MLRCPILSQPQAFSSISGNRPLQTKIDLAPGSTARDDANLADPGSSVFRRIYGTSAPSDPRISEPLRAPSSSGSCFYTGVPVDAFGPRLAEIRNLTQSRTTDKLVETEERRHTGRKYRDRSTVYHQSS
ncbi:unnamed protein product, partial [Ectocarpus sp. 4 AP-2014]